MLAVENWNFPSSKTGLCWEYNARQDGPAGSTLLWTRGGQGGLSQAACL